jgi:hypothetical protein
MGETPARDPPGAVAHARADAAPLPADLEKLRLRFELELFESQDAGASLDPLLRRAEMQRPGSQREPDRET